MNAGPFYFASWSRALVAVGTSNPLTPTSMRICDMNAGPFYFASWSRALVAVGTSNPLTPTSMRICDLNAGPFYFTSWSRALEAVGTSNPLTPTSMRICDMNAGPFYFTSWSRALVAVGTSNPLTPTTTSRRTYIFDVGSFFIPILDGPPGPGPSWRSVLQILSLRPNFQGSYSYSLSIVLTGFMILNSMKIKIMPNSID